MARDLEQSLHPEPGLARTADPERRRRRLAGQQRREWPAAASAWSAAPAISKALWGAAPPQHVLTLVVPWKRCVGKSHGVGSGVGPRTCSEVSVKPLPHAWNVPPPRRVTEDP